MKKYKHRNEEFLKSIFTSLYENQFIMFNPQKGFILHSGIWSPLYIQLRKLISYPKILNQITDGLVDLFEAEILNKEKNKSVNYCFLGLAMAGIPIATALSLKTNLKALMTRKIQGSLENFDELIKQYGNHSLIEGTLEKNQSLILVDDLMTSFKSKQNALKLVNFELKKQNIPQSSVSVDHVIIILDREQANLKEIEEKYKIKVHSLIKLKSQGLGWIKNNLSIETVTCLEKYFESQNKKS